MNGGEQLSQPESIGDLARQLDVAHLAYLRARYTLGQQILAQGGGRAALPELQEALNGPRGTAALDSVELRPLMEDVFRVETGMQGGLIDPDAPVTSAPIPPHDHSNDRY